MRHGEQLVIFLLAVLLIPVIFLLFWPLMLYVRFAKPRSGITIGLVVSNRWTDLLQYMRLPFDWALFRAGAKVRTIGPKHHAQIETILKEIDGLILTGGEDLNPTLHDGDDSMLVDVNKARDDLEMDILDFADKNSIPYLCVCRGSQLMAIRAGGVITSHHYGDEKIGNHISSLTKAAKHPIKLLPETRIASIFSKDEINVNSFHHLLISSSGKSKATGFAVNDVIEVIEKPGDNFAVGVQWHPEFMAPFDKSQQQLFNALVQHIIKKTP